MLYEMSTIYSNEFRLTQQRLYVQGLVQAMTITPVSFYSDAKIEERRTNDTDMS